jgi:peptide-methionine (R)-S-oxide reductase
MKSCQKHLRSWYITVRNNRLQNNRLQKHLLAKRLAVAVDIEMEGAMPKKPTNELPQNESEWRSRLTPEQFRITRESGTERAFTGPWLNEKRGGLYSCIACDAPLFTSTAKYESGSGWPSFFQPVSNTALIEHEDVSLGMRRVEIRCATCQSHLGHVFPDGPNPTGLRYCTNGTALNFNPEE